MHYDNQASYEPDMAELIDTEEEIAADRYGVSLETARIIVQDRKQAITRERASGIGGFIGFCIAQNNPLAVLYGFALAAGLDQLNGVKSETQVAKRLGCTRALVSHYVVAARDILSGAGRGFDVLKFRKRNDTRETYANRAKSPFIQAKRQKLNQITK